MKTKTKIKVVEVNSKGLVEITPEKLERMLNEAYLEGYNDNNYVSLTYGNAIDTSSNYALATSAQKASTLDITYTDKITAFEDGLVK